MDVIKPARSRFIPLVLLLGWVVPVVAWLGGLSGPFAAPRAAGEPRPVQAGGPSPNETPPADPLADVNASFRAAYAAARKEVLARSGPILVVEGDDLVLVRSGRRTQARVVPPAYHTLKAVCHIPLAVYVLLVPLGEGDLGPERLASLSSFRQQLNQADRGLPDCGLSEIALDRQRKVLAASRQFLDGVLEAKKFRTADVGAFTRGLKPLVLDNIADAARLQLDALDRQVRAWKTEMTPAEWKALRVVIMGSAMPRKGNINVQYFSRLLGEPGEGPRVIYAEALFDEGRALNLLGTHQLDSQIGAAFFDDPRRMHRDLMADAARARLEEMTFDP